MPESNQKSDIRRSLLKYAANILSRRPYFRNALKEKLYYRSEKEGFLDSGDIIEDIISELAKSGYLDDLYLAQAYVRRQLSKCYGPRIISLKLKQLRLDSSTIRAALDSEALPEPQMQAITKFANKYRHVDPRKVSYKLYSRGFSGDLIKKVFDETDIPD